MISKHTPGPWTIERGTINRVFVFSHGQHNAVCECHAVRAEANARLIASAPEMLEALKEVIATTDDADWLTRFQSIIAKAEGRES